jgi:hypothetical protein
MNTGIIHGEPIAQYHAKPAAGAAEGCGMTHMSDQFTQIFSDPRGEPKDILETEDYQKFVDSMVPFCHCTDHNRPCDGVLAGGLCDNVQDTDDDYEAMLDRDAENEAERLSNGDV